MHDDLQSYTQNPSQKFHKNFINFERPPKIFKNPKPWSKCMKNEWRRSYQVIWDKKRLKIPWVEGFEREESV